MQDWRDRLNMDIVRRLADALARRELVLFLGAGVSMEAGLPDWRGLDTCVVRTFLGRRHLLRGLDEKQLDAVVSLFIEQHGSVPGSAVEHVRRQMPPEPFAALVRRCLQRPSQM